MEKLYSEFKLVFEGDSKVNITAIDTNGYVLGHLAILFNKPDNISAGLQKLSNQLEEKSLISRVFKYEVVYPTTKDDEDDSKYAIAY